MRIMYHHVVQNAWHFADGISKCITLNVFCLDLTVHLEIVTAGSINSLAPNRRRAIILTNDQ